MMKHNMKLFYRFFKSIKEIVVFIKDGCGENLTSFIGIIVRINHDFKIAGQYFRNNS